jgi:hypothetical protein
MLLCSFGKSPEPSPLYMLPGQKFESSVPRSNPPAVEKLPSTWSPEELFAMFSGALPLMSLWELILGICEHPCSVNLWPLE